MYNTTVIFNDVLNPVSDNIADNLVNKIDDRIVLVYDESKQKNLSYLIQNKDPKVYEGVLDYCEVMNVSHLFLSFLYFPEYLLAELSRRKNLKTKISFVFDWRLFRISKTRTNVMKKLIKKKNIAKVIVHGNIPFYDRERKAIINDERISLKKIYEAYIPIFYETEKIKNKDALEKLGLDKNKFWLLYFGRMFYGRGLDRIIKVMDNSFIKEKDINLLVVSQSEHLNYDLDLESLKSKDNIKFIDSYVPQEMVKYYFSAASSVVLPFRNSYFHGSSAVLIQACQYKKPIIAPNFYPFGNIIRDYGIGETFFPHSEERFVVSSMTKAVLNVYDGSYYSNGGFLEYTNKFQTWEEYIKNLF